MNTGNTGTNLGVLLQQAAVHLQAGRVAEGTALCRQVLEQAPGQADALHLLAMAVAAQGAAAEAEKLFLESLDQAPGRPDILVNFGKFLKNHGQVAEGEKRLREAVKLDPKLVPAWYNLGLLLHGLGELDEAADCARKVTGLARGYPAGWELLAAIRQKQGDLAAAIKACQEGLHHEPRAPRLYYSLAQLQRQECEFAEAAASYERARQQGFEAPDLYRNRAEALLESGDLEQALVCATSGVERFPDQALLHRTRARLHFEAGADGDPVAELWQAARQQPANAGLWCTLAQLLERLQREDEGLAALSEARKLGCPATAEFRMYEAMAIAGDGRAGEATVIFDELVAANPEHNDIKLTFAGHLLTQGDPARAESLCAEVLEEDPWNQLGLCYRGTAWQLLGDPRESWLLDYERMVRPVPVPVPEGYDSQEAFFRDVQSALESLHRTQAHPIEQSLRGGTQTNGFLFRLKHPLLRVLEKQIRLAIATALADFPDEPEHPFWGRRVPSPSGDGMRFAGAWSVRLRSEGYHTHHIHTEGWVSSALYIALPDEVREDEGQAGHIEFGVPMVELGLDLPAQRTVRPEVGTLVLFPSYMWHGTVPFTSQQPRITVAFDLLPQN